MPKDSMATDAFNSGLFSLANSQVQELQEQNHRLRLAIALLRYKRPRSKGGRPVTTDDPATFLAKHELARRQVAKTGQPAKTQTDVARYLQRTEEEISGRRWPQAKRDQWVKTYCNRLAAAKRAASQ
jgi:hypothetical protein